MSKEENKEVKEEVVEEVAEETAEDVVEEKKEPDSDEIIEGLKAELDKAKNDVARAYADTENMKKRLQKDADTARKSYPGASIREMVLNSICQLLYTFEC